MMIIKSFSSSYIIYSVFVFSYYPEGKIQEFDNIECEWPMFYAFMVIDGVFKQKSEQIVKYQMLMKKVLCNKNRFGGIFQISYKILYDSVFESHSHMGFIQVDIFIVSAYFSLYGMESYRHEAIKE